VSKDPAIIFVHLPKCGGTTLNRIMEWEYPPWRVFSVDPSFFRWSYRRLLRWPARRLVRMKAFKGHMPFGLHKLLPQPSTYITVLRDPVDRAVSEYYYALSRFVHPQHRMMKKLTLDEYIRTTTYANVQTKLIAGLYTGYDFLSGDCTSETLETAKHNLSQHFSLVGLTERFDESLALAKLLFGWQLRHYADFNVTSSRPKTDEVPLGVRELVAERYQFDMQLYEYAVGLFNGLVGSHAEGVRKELEKVREARALSGIESTYYRAASAARKAISRIYSAI